MHLGDAVVGGHVAVVHGDEADAEPVVDAFAHELDGLARGLGAGELAVMCRPSSSASMLVTRPMSSPCCRLIFTLSREPKSVSGSNTSA